MIAYREGVGLEPVPGLILVACYYVGIFGPPCKFLVCIYNMAVQKIYSIVGIGDIFNVFAVRGPLVLQVIPNLMGMLVVLNDDFIYHCGAVLRPNSWTQLGQKS
jgi:hypothetical protein